jgi:hypothetical protein
MSRLFILVAAVALAAVACTTTGSGGATTGPAVATSAPAAAEAPAATPAPTAAATDPQQIDVRVSWDGVACTYTGPTDIPRGARMTFAMTNTDTALKDGHDGAVLVFAAVDAGTAKSDFEAWKVEHPKGSQIPPWLDQAELIGPLYPEGAAAGDTMSHVMTADQYIVLCGESPKDGEAVHLATFLETKDR